MQTIACRTWLFSQSLFQPLKHWEEAYQVQVRGCFVFYCHLFSRLPFSAQLVANNIPKLQCRSFLIGTHLTATPARNPSTMKDCHCLVKSTGFASSLCQQPWPFSLHPWLFQDTFCYHVSRKKKRWPVSEARFLSRQWWLLCSQVQRMKASQLYPAFESKSIKMTLLCHLCLFYDQLTPFFLVTGVGPLFVQVVWS